jgi:hypothetical protein
MITTRFLNSTARPIFHRLALAARERLDFIVGADIVTQPELADHTACLVTHHPEIEEWQAEKAFHGSRPR